MCVHREEFIYYGQPMGKNPDSREQAYRRRFYALFCFLLLIFFFIAGHIERCKCGKKGCLDMFDVILADFFGKYRGMGIQMKRMGS